MALFISVIVFMSVVGLFLFINKLFSNQQETVEKRLIRYAGMGKKVSLYEAQMEESFIKRVVLPFFNSFTTKIVSLTPENWKNRMDDQLSKAGNPYGLTIDQFIVIQLLVVVAFPFIILILTLGLGLEKAVLLALIASLIGMILPNYILQTKIRERTLKIQEGLPDLLDLLTVSVEAGLGFDASLSKVIEKSEGPLSFEFKLLLQEIRIGRPRLEAFRELSRRSNTPDLSTFCSAIIQADQLGVGIGKVLRIQSDQMRLKRRQRAEEAAMKAPIKMVFPLILLVFPALFLILLGPAMIRLITVFGGM